MLDDHRFDGLLDFRHAGMYTMPKVLTQGKQWPERVLIGLVRIENKMLTALETPITVHTSATRRDKLMTTPAISIRMHLGLWTIFSGAQPIISCRTLADALALVQP